MTQVPQLSLILTLLLVLTGAAVPLGAQIDTTTRGAKNAAEAIALMPDADWVELRSLWSRDRVTIRTVDPLTTAAAVVSIASGLNSMFSGDSRRLKDIQRKLTVISAQIDALHTQQARILDELIALRVYFRAELKREFLHALSVRMDAHIDRWEAVLAYSETFANARTREDLRFLRRDLTQTGGELFGYGPAAYQSAFTSTAALEATYELERALTGAAGRRQLRAEERAALTQLVPRYELWVDAGTPDGLPAAMRRTTQLRDSVRSVLTSSPTELRLRRVEGPSTPDGRCFIWPLYDEYLIISGSLEAGYSDRRELRLVKWERGNCEPPPGCWRCLSLAPLDDESRGEVPAPAGTAAVTQNALTSMHPATERLNALRAEYLRLVTELEMQSRVAENVRDVVRHLRERIRLLTP